MKEWRRNRLKGGGDANEWPQVKIRRREEVNKHENRRRKGERKGGRKVDLREEWEITAGKVKTGSNQKP